MLHYRVAGVVVASDARLRFSPDESGDTPSVTVQQVNTLPSRPEAAATDGVGGFWHGDTVWLEPPSYALPCVIGPNLVRYARRDTMTDGEVSSYVSD